MTLENAEIWKSLVTASAKIWRDAREPDADLMSLAKRMRDTGQMIIDQLRSQEQDNEKQCA